MKQNFFFYQDDTLFVGFSLPREITEQKMDDFLQIDAETQQMYPARLCDLAEGQGAILAFLENADSDYKTGFLPVAEYLKILEGPVFNAIYAAQYLYTEMDGDREKLVQRTRALFAFVLGYIELYAYSDEEIGDQIVRDECGMFIEVLEADEIEIDWSGGLFQTNELFKQYIDTWYIE